MHYSVRVSTHRPVFMLDDLAYVSRQVLYPRYGYGNYRPRLKSEVPHVDQVGGARRIEHVHQNIMVPVALCLKSPPGHTQWGFCSASEHFSPSVGRSRKFLRRE